jgi:hypothetical protein
MLSAIADIPILSTTPRLGTSPAARPGRKRGDLSGILPLSLSLTLFGYVMRVRRMVSARR